MCITDQAGTAQFHGYQDLALSIRKAGDLIFRYNTSKKQWRVFEIFFANFLQTVDANKA